MRKCRFFDATLSLIYGQLLFVTSLLSCSVFTGLTAGGAEIRRPNVLFISIDDLNDWIGCLGGHPQALTPNLDRLAESGILFTNAHCVAPACNPSRTAIFSGIAPNVSGLYRNEQSMRQVLPNAKLLPEFLREHGYRSLGSGKLLHYVIDARSWDEYFPSKESENPFPSHIPWGTRPKSLPRGGSWQYVETDWHPFDVSDKEFGGDYHTASFVADQLSKQHETPFFIGCGIYRPHEPWFNPKHYFDQFPIETIQLPPGYLEDDLDDIPPAGVRLARNRYFDHIRQHGEWKEAIRAYLASISFADANLGRVLDALESGPNRDNTIVILWSDHGWHLGEKQHWQKFTGWRSCTRVPLMVRVPKGVAGLPEGTKAGEVCDKPVDLLGLFLTVSQLCGLDAPDVVQGESLVPLLRDTSTDWEKVAVTYLGRPNAFALSGQRYRYIRYATAEEEFYDISADPYEWQNIAGDDRCRSEISRFRQLAPKQFATLTTEMNSEGHERKMTPCTDWAGVVSQPSGASFSCCFQNHSEEEVELLWIDRAGESHPYGTIAPRGQRFQSTRVGAVWVARTLDDSHTYTVRVQAGDYVFVIGR